MNLTTPRLGANAGLCAAAAGAIFIGVQINPGHVLAVAEWVIRRSSSATGGTGTRS